MRAVEGYACVPSPCSSPSSTCQPEGTSTETTGGGLEPGFSICACMAPRVVDCPIMPPVSLHACGLLAAKKHSLNMLFVHAYWSEKEIYWAMHDHGGSLLHK